MLQHKGKLLIYMHIPKTGGTTLSYEIIKRQYQDVTEYTAGSKIQTIKDKIEQSEVLMGHLNFGVHRHFSKPSIYISMLRDPVERVISEYYYIKKEPKHDQFVHQIIKSNNMSLEDYVNYNHEKFLLRTQNYQTRYFCGGYTPNLEQAKKNLANHFLIVGITEQFDDSISLMKHELGWEDIEYEKINVNADRPLKNQCSTKTIEKIIGNNKLDVELYKFTKNLLNKKLKNI